MNEDSIDDLINEAKKIRKRIRLLQKKLFNAEKGYDRFRSESSASYWAWSHAGIADAEIHYCIEYLERCKEKTSKSEAEK